MRFRLCPSLLRSPPQPDSDPTGLRPHCAFAAVYLLVESSFEAARQAADLGVLANPFGRGKGFPS